MNNEKNWKDDINVRDFIQENYTPYDGDESFLQGPTNRTKAMWANLQEMIKQEREKGIMDLDTDIPSTITSFGPGYIDKENELIVGLQTDKPLKRSIKPNGGIRLVEKAAESYGYKVNPEVVKVFTEYKKTHNDGVFSAYSKDIRLLRSKHVITGLPDNYGRGRIIGDYRRVALYGIDKLVQAKQADYNSMPEEMTEENIRLREEIFEQVKALNELKTMAASYGLDISKPANDSKEAIQWVYLGYLGAVKQQDGAAMSLGRLDAFLDVFIEKDLKEGKYTESQVQEFIDDFVMKLRIVRQLRPPEYNALFAGDPTWVTLVLGGTSMEGKSMVTKTSYRFLNTLTNLGPAPEPNLTVLWADKLPENWKKYCVTQSIKTSSIQYESDDLMKPYYGDDYAIACCVSGMSVGKDMQLFGARANIVKPLLMAINGGKSEPTIGEDGVANEGGETIMPGLEPLNKNEYLDYDEVWNQYMKVLDWVAQRYVGAMNVIHYMHDKYYYESLEMALHDTNVRRFMAFGAAGLSIVADSLSAIKYAKVKPVWNEQGVAKEYIVEGDFPKYGNDDDRVDSIAVEVVKQFATMLRKNKTYRNAVHTLSILTITSNVVYGKATGATPDGRAMAVPFAPGANPMHGRDTHGAISSLNSVAKIPYNFAQDGISNTFSIVPSAVGKDLSEQQNNLVQLLDGYFVGKGAHHLNVNVLNRETLLDAQAHPENYPQLTIRVSGYAVLFNRLSKEQQDEVISRTFHERR